MLSTAELSPVQADGGWERTKVGDRLVAFSVLLPARAPGPVALAVDEDISSYLAERYCGATILVRARTARILDAARSPVVVWDGVHSPLASGSMSLIVVDERLASVAALRAALASDGVLAVLGTRGEYVLYPSIAHPEHVWRRGWPLPAKSGPVTQLRRSAGLRLSRWRNLPRLSFAGAAFRSLADLVLTDLEAQSGSPARLVGIETAGQTILRARRPDGDVAIRLSLSASGGGPDTAARVAAEVPEARPLILPELAAGRSAGFGWSVTAWLPRGRRPAGDVWRGERRRWAVAEQLATALQTRPTGVIPRGWAGDWCADVATIPREVRTRFVAAMAPLEDALPTGWCHGDLWPANVVLDRDGAAVIDWENAVPGAPLGLDWLLIAGLREVTANTDTMAGAFVRMIDGSLPVTQDVAGRPFTEWGHEQRVALVVAAFVHYLRNRSLHDMGGELLRGELDVLLAALSAGPSAAPTSQAARAARGAFWLGLGAVVVKGAQTVVLLVIAALLAPSALGLLAIGALVTNVAQTLSDMGASTGLIYWRGNPARVARTALTVSAATSLAIASAVWVAAPWIGQAMHGGPDASWVIRGLVSVLPCYGIAAVSQELLRRDLAFVRRIVPDVVAAVLGAVLSVVLALRGHGLAGVVAGQIVQGVATMVLTWVVGRLVWPAWNRADAKVLLRYGGHLTAASVLGLVLLNVDYIMVARVLGGTALGQYSLAFRLAYLPYLNIAFVIAGAAFPYLCRLSGAATGRALERVLTAALTMLIPVCVGMALFADQLTLLGGKWAPAVTAVRWLALYAALLGTAQFLYTALNAVGRPRTTMLLRLLHLVSLVAVLVLLVRHGVAAVAAGQVVAGVVAAGSALLLGRRQIAGLRLNCVAVALLPALAGAACMTVVVLAIQQAFPSTLVSAAGLACLGALAVVAYLVPVALLGRAELAHTIRTVRGQA